MKKIRCILFLAIGMLFCLTAIAQPQPAGLSKVQQDSVRQEMASQKRAVVAQFAKAQLTVMVTCVGNSQFGYYILADGNILIDQKNIPAVNGNKGFVSEAEAKRTAEFAIKKLKQGEMPPTISVNDLRRLKITLPSSH
jgi:hypothetical protein